MDDLQELLARVFGKISEEDMEDPEIAALMSQLLAVLEPKAQELPPELVAQLSSIADKKQRFVAAVTALNAMDESSIKEVADKMVQSGLLKNENLEGEIERAKNADLIELPRDVDGTNCGNCKFINSERRYCNHPKVDQEVHPRLCCAFWDKPGSIRIWEVLSERR